MDYLNKHFFKIFCAITSFFLVMLSEKDPQKEAKQNEVAKELITFIKKDVEKYNEYISFYHYELDGINISLFEYLKCQDDEINLKKHKQPFKHFSSEVDNVIWWNTKKKISKKKPAIKELDEAAEELIPPAEELIQLLNTAAKYYKARDYLDDKYEKGLELHTKIWETEKIYIIAYTKFEEALINEWIKRRNTDMDYAKKTGNKFAYNKILVAILMEKIINEFEMQRLTQQRSEENVASIDLSKIKPLYDEFNQAQRALREAKENQKIKDHDTYVSITTDFKLKLLEIIEIIEKKESIKYEYESLYSDYKHSISAYNNTI